MRKALTLLYGGASYLIFFATFLYLIAFLADLWVPTSIDRGPEASLPVALAIDLGLIALFGIQHSAMARSGFKERWTKLVPKPIERSTYVLATSAVLILMFWQWRPIDIPIWEATSSVGRGIGYGVLALGTLIVLVSTFIINHFELFGLRQVATFAAGREDVPLSFQARFLYRFVRHPIYLGWTVAFWGTPRMTGGHLLFAAGMTAYMLIAIQLEEADLVERFGGRYERYRRRVPMLLPWRGRRVADDGARSEPVAG